jgi:hypothetical protein
MLKRLKAQHPDLTVLSPRDQSFELYGRYLTDEAWKKLAGQTRKLISADDVPSYLPSCRELENGGMPKSLLTGIFGDEDVQIGVCRGFNDRLNGMEWHDCPEVVAACTPHGADTGPSRGYQKQPMAQSPGRSLPPRRGRCRRPSQGHPPLRSLPCGRRSVPERDSSASRGECRFTAHRRNRPAAVERAEVADDPCRFTPKKSRSTSGHHRQKHSCGADYLMDRLNEIAQSPEFSIADPLCLGYNLLTVTK